MVELSLKRIRTSAPDSVVTMSPTETDSFALASRLAFSVVVTVALPETRLRVPASWALTGAAKNKAHQDKRNPLKIAFNFMHDLHALSDDLSKFDFLFAVKSFVFHNGFLC